MRVAAASTAATAGVAVSGRLGGTRQHPRMTGAAGAAGRVDDEHGRLERERMTGGRAGDLARPGAEDVTAGQEVDVLGQRRGEAGPAIGPRRGAAALRPPCRTFVLEGDDPSGARAAQLG